MSSDWPPESTSANEVLSSQQEPESIQSARSGGALSSGGSSIKGLSGMAGDGKLVAPSVLPPDGPVEKSERPGGAPESCGQLARAVCLFALLGMALAVLVRLGVGGTWVLPFISKNQLSMPERVALIYQMVATGALAAILPLILVLLRTPFKIRAAECEGWAWFLSPLILLPAVPVIGRHQIWIGKHQELLPIILFGSLIAEVLISKASEHAPRKFTARLVNWWRDDGSAESRFWEVLQRRGALLLVWTAALVYGAFMSFYAVRWHNKLGTAIFDLGINNNLMFGGLLGHFNESPVIFPDDPKMYVANHVKAGLYVFLPIYALSPRPETLIVIQAISLGLGAVPLFLFARRRLPESWSVALTLAYLCYYPLHGANFYEMKEPPTAAAIVLASIWAIDTKRFVLGSIFFTWALIMREDMPIPLAVVGACFLLSGARPRAGLVMTLVASTWFVILRFFIMNEAGSWWFPNMYEGLWAAPEKGFQGVIKTLVSNPTYTLSQIFVEKKFWYLMHMMVPLAFLPARRWWGWAAFVPGAILTLLVTDYDPPITFSFQYVMHWAPYAFLAAVLVLAAIRKGELGVHRSRGALAAMCLSSLALTYNYGAFSLRDKALASGYHEITFSFTEKDKRTLEDVRRLVASIPPLASVASSERIGAHLSSRYAFYTLRRGSHGAEYIVARETELRLDRTKESVREALHSGKYGVVGRFGEFAVLRKGASTEENASLLFEWGLDSTGSSRMKTSRRKRALDGEGSSNGTDPEKIEASAPSVSP